MATIKANSRRTQQIWRRKGPARHLPMLLESHRKGRVPPPNRTGLRSSRTWNGERSSKKCRRKKFRRNCGISAPTNSLKPLPISESDAGFWITVLVWFWLSAFCFQYIGMVGCPTQDEGVSVSVRAPLRGKDWAWG